MRVHALVLTMLLLSGCKQEAVPASTAAVPVSTATVAAKPPRRSAQITALDNEVKLVLDLIDSVDKKDLQKFADLTKNAIFVDNSGGRTIERKVVYEDVFGSDLSSGRGETVLSGIQVMRSGPRENIVNVQWTCNFVTDCSPSETFEMNDKEIVRITGKFWGNP